jgi:hypothetical protein
MGTANKKVRQLIQRTRYMSDRSRHSSIICQSILAPTIVFYPRPSLRQSEPYSSAPYYVYTPLLRPRRPPTRFHPSITDQAVATEESRFCSNICLSNFTSIDHMNWRSPSHSTNQHHASCRFLKTLPDILFITPPDCHLHRSRIGTAEWHAELGVV